MVYYRYDAATIWTSMSVLISLARLMKNSMIMLTWV